MLYEAVIIDKPNADLVKWIKALIIVNTVFSLFTAYQYELHNASKVSWWYLFFSWLLCGILIPILGLKASEALDKRRLLFFSGIQWFIGFWNLINCLAFTSVLASVISWCTSDECQRQFLMSNNTCRVFVADDEFDMAASYCDEIPYNVCTAFFFALISYVSCFSATSARTMQSVKVITAISVESQVVPSIPEDEPMGVVLEAVQ